MQGKLGASAAVFGPFDCDADPHCADSWGTEDPRLTYDPDTNLYYLLYNAWDGSRASLSLATTVDPSIRGGW